MTNRLIEGGRTNDFKMDYSTLGHFYFKPDKLGGS